MSSILPDPDDVAVDSAVSHWRNTDYLVGYPAVDGAVCPFCGSGEVLQPMQQMDMPMHMRCLRCNHRNPTEDFLQ